MLSRLQALTRTHGFRAQYERLMALAQGTEAKKALLPLRLAVYTFFTIWIVFPLVWILGTQGLGLISDEVQEVLHCLCDIVAKSFYGFALARYRSYFDKKLFKLLEELGFDGEEELQNLEKDLKEIHGVSSQIGYASGAMDRKNSFNQPGPPLGGRLSGEIQRRRSMEFTPLGGQGGQPISLMVNLQFNSLVRCCLGDVFYNSSFSIICPAMLASSQHAGRHGCGLTLRGAGG